MDWSNSLNCQNCVTLNKKLELFDLLKQKCCKTDDIIKNLLLLKASHDKLLKTNERKSKSLADAKCKLKDLEKADDLVKSANRKLSECQLRLVSSDTKVQDLLKEIGCEREKYSALLKVNHDLEEAVESRESHITSLSLIAQQSEEKYLNDVQALKLDLEKSNDAVKTFKRDLQSQVHANAAMRKKYDTLVTSLLDTFKNDEFATAESLKKLKRIVGRLQAKDNAAKLEAELNSPSMTPDGATSLDTGIFSGDEDICSPSLVDELQVSSEGSDDEFEDVGASSKFTMDFSSLMLKENAAKPTESNDTFCHNSNLQQNLPLAQAFSQNSTFKSQDLLKSQDLPAASLSGVIDSFDDTADTLCLSPNNSISHDVEQNLRHADTSPSISVNLPELDSRRSDCSPSRSPSPRKATKRSLDGSSSKSSSPLATHCAKKTHCPMEVSMQLPDITSPIALNGLDSELMSSMSQTNSPIQVDVMPHSLTSPLSKPSNAISIHSSEADPCDLPIAASKCARSDNDSKVEASVSELPDNESILNIPSPPHSQNNKEPDIFEDDLETIFNEWTAPSPVSPFTEDSCSFEGKITSVASNVEESIFRTCSDLGLSLGEEEESQNLVSVDEVASSPDSVVEASQKSLAASPLNEPIGSEPLCNDLGSAMFPEDVPTYNLDSSSELVKHMKHTGTDPQKYMRDKAVSPMKRSCREIGVMPIQEFCRDVATSPKAVGRKNISTSPIKRVSRDSAVSPIKFLQSNKASSPVKVQMKTIALSPFKDIDGRTWLEKRCDKLGETEHFVRNEKSALFSSEKNSELSNDSKETNMLLRAMDMLGINLGNDSGIVIDKTLVDEVRFAVEMALKNVQQNDQYALKAFSPLSRSRSLGFCPFEKCELADWCDQQHHSLHMLMKAKHVEEAICKSKKEEFKTKRLGGPSSLDRKLFELEDTSETIPNPIAKIKAKATSEPSSSWNKPILSPAVIVAEGSLMAPPKILRCSGENPQNIFDSIEVQEKAGECSERLNKHQADVSVDAVNQQVDFKGKHQPKSPVKTNHISLNQNIMVEEIYSPNIISHQNRSGDNLLSHHLEENSISETHTEDVSIANVEYSCQNVKRRSICNDSEALINAPCRRQVLSNESSIDDTANCSHLSMEDVSSQSLAENHVDGVVNNSTKEQSMCKVTKITRQSSRKRLLTSTENSTTECESGSSEVLSVRRSPRIKKVRVARDWNSDSKQSYQRGYIKFVKGESRFVCNEPTEVDDLSQPDDPLAVNNHSKPEECGRSQITESESVMSSPSNNQSPLKGTMPVMDKSESTECLPPNDQSQLKESLSDIDDCESMDSFSSNNQSGEPKTLSADNQNQPNEISPLKNHLETVRSTPTMKSVIENNKYGKESPKLFPEVSNTSKGSIAFQPDCLKQNHTSLPSERERPASHCTARKKQRVSQSGSSVKRCIESRSANQEAKRLKQLKCEDDCNMDILREDSTKNSLEMGSEILGFESDKNKDANKGAAACSTAASSQMPSNVLRVSARKPSKLQKLRSSVSKIHPLTQAVKAPRSVCDKNVDGTRTDVSCMRSEDIPKSKTQEEVAKDGNELLKDSLTLPQAQAVVLEKFRGRETLRMAAPASGRTALLIDVKPSLPKSAASHRLPGIIRSRVSSSPLRKVVQNQPLVRPEDRISSVKSCSAVTVEGDQQEIHIASSRNRVPAVSSSQEEASIGSDITERGCPKTRQVVSTKPASEEVSKVVVNSKSSMGSSLFISKNTTPRKTTLSPMALAITEANCSETNRCDKIALASTENTVKQILKNFVAATSFTPEILQKAIDALSPHDLLYAAPVIVRDVVNMVEDDYDSNPIVVPGRQNLFVPQLTPVQQQLLTLILQLSFQQNHFKTLPHQVLRLIEYRMFRLGLAPLGKRLVWYSKLYASICRALRLRSLALIFCWDALYALKSRYYEVVKSVMEVWPHLFPINPSFNQACPNAQVMLHILRSHVDKAPPGAEANKPDNSWLKRLLKSSGLQALSINSSILASNFVTNLLGDGVRTNTTAIVLLAKQEGEHWAFQNIVSSNLLPALDRWRNGSLGDKAGEQVVWTLCSILRVLSPSQTGGLFTTLMKLFKSDLLKDEGIASPHMQEVIAISLALLSRHDIENVAVSLISWKPTHGLTVGYSSHLCQQLTDLVNNGIRPLHWWQEQLRQISKSHLEE